MQFPQMNKHKSKTGMTFHEVTLLLNMDKTLPIRLLDRAERLHLRDLRWRRVILVLLANSSLIPLETLLQGRLEAPSI